MSNTSWSRELWNPSKTLCLQVSTACCSWYTRTRTSFDRSSTSSASTGSWTFPRSGWRQRSASQHVSAQTSASRRWIWRRRTLTFLFNQITGSTSSNRQRSYSRSVPVPSASILRSGSWLFNMVLAEVRRIGHFWWSNSSYTRTTGWSRHLRRTSVRKTQMESFSWAFWATTWSRLL